MAADAAKNQNGSENEEIDRIMKEIEDLEKKMDTSSVEDEEAVSKVVSMTPEKNTPVSAPSQHGAPPVVPEVPEVPELPELNESTNIVNLRSGSMPTEDDSATETEVASSAERSSSESLVESDAVPVSDEPLMRSASSDDSGLALKVGGCTEVSLEFTRAGVTVSLSCSEEGLTITTDQGAEFRLPFQRIHRAA